MHSDTVCSDLRSTLAVCSCKSSMISRSLDYHHNRIHAEHPPPSLKSPTHSIFSGWPAGPPPGSGNTGWTALRAQACHPELSTSNALHEGPVLDPAGLRSVSQMTNSEKGRPSSVPRCTPLGRHDQHEDGWAAPQAGTEQEQLLWALQILHPRF